MKNTPPVSESLCTALVFKYVQFVHPVTNTDVQSEERTRTQRNVTGVQMTSHNAGLGMFVITAVLAVRDATKV